MPLPSPYLIKKYNVAAPRYTSYPTAIEFKTNFTSENWGANLACTDFQIGALSIYLHVPFCASLCYFCACHKIISPERPVVRNFIRALRCEMDCYRQYIGDCVPISQIHWGGGSPGFLSIEETFEVESMLRLAFPNQSTDCERSVEADPRSCSEDKLNFLRELGFNRISFGVQDFDSAVQKAVHRIQPFELTKEVVLNARQLGFKSINLDLIYGLPLQSVSSFSRTVEQVLSLKPSRIAFYGYAHVPWLRKTQKTFEKCTLPSAAERLAIFNAAVEMLEQAGYIYIGLDHFALPDDELVQAQLDGSLTRNFMGYTVSKAIGLIGLGPSAVSALPNCYAQNAKDLKAYSDAVRHGCLPTERGKQLTSDDLMRAEVIQRLLCFARIDLQNLEERWQRSFWQVFPEAVKKLKVFEDEGILEISTGAVELTPVGRFFMRNVAMTFDAYVTRHQAKAQPVYSSAL